MGRKGLDVLRLLFFAVSHGIQAIRGKGVGTGGDMSPPIFETGAFVPPKNYTMRRKIFDYILKAQQCLVTGPLNGVLYPQRSRVAPVSTNHNEMPGLSILSSWLAQMKLVPWSERICFAGPLIAKNVLRALMQLLAIIASNTLMCTALMHIHDNMTAHLLLM